MIPFLLAIAAAAPLTDLPGGDPARAAACAALIKSDAGAAVEQADAWAKRSADVPAQQCLALALVAAERWAPAALTFEQAATGAEQRGDGRAAGLWVQAGNAALAAEDAGRARTDLDRGLALPTLADPMRGEALLDRARALVALGDMAGARTDLDSALRLVAGDPFAWLLSATLARRQDDLPRATTDIAQARRLAGDDPTVLLEAGNIASASGRADEATQAWTRLAQIAPASAEGRAATAALAGK